MYNLNIKLFRKRSTVCFILRNNIRERLEWMLLRWAEVHICEYMSYRTTNSNACLKKKKDLRHVTASVGKGSFKYGIIFPRTNFKSLSHGMTDAPAWISVQKSQDVDMKLLKKGVWSVDSVTDVRR